MHNRLNEQQEDIDDLKGQKLVEMMDMILGIVSGELELEDIGRTQCSNNSLFVSTVNTPDMGLETAIVDKNGAHPVERYSSEESARLGHEKWVKFCEDDSTLIKTVTKLGYELFKIKERDIVLQY